MARLPTITSNIPRDLRQYLERVREVLSARDGNALVTVDELVNSGLASQNNGSLGPSEPNSLSTPPSPSNLQTTGALAGVVLTWDAPNYAGHAHTEIWAAQAPTGGGVPVLGDAVLVGMAPGEVHTHDLGQAATRWYWVRFVNTEATAGAYNAVNGVQGTTGDDPAYLMDVLTEAYGTGSESPYFQLLSTTVINGVSVPAGTYMYDAFIYNGSITNAKIGTAAIDTAKIVDAAISTAKISDAAITNAKIGTAAIDTAKIVDAAVASAKIADAAVTNAKIGTAAVGTAQIADASITNAKIVDASIQNAKIADATITNAKIADATIGGVKIANNAVTADKISVSDLSAISANLGTITVATANLGDASVTTLKLADGSTLTEKLAANSVTTLRTASYSGYPYGNKTTSITWTPTHSGQWIAVAYGSLQVQHSSGTPTGSTSLTLGGTTPTVVGPQNGNSSVVPFTLVAFGSSTSGVSETVSLTSSATGGSVVLMAVHKLAVLEVVR